MGAEADPVRIALREVLPVVTVQLLGDPHHPVPRVQVSLESLSERRSTDKAGHLGVVVVVETADRITGDSCLVDGRTTDKERTVTA